MDRLAEAHWPADLSAPLLEMTVGDLLARAAGRTPDAPASYVLEGDTIIRRSFAELRGAATTAAAHLLALAEPGERIAVWGPNSDAWVVAHHGIAAAGLVLVPVNPALTDDEAAHVLADSGAAVLLAAERFRGSALAERAQALTARLPALRHAAPLTALLEPADPVGLPSVSPGDIALIQYTSGTTGRPKGAVLTHRAVVNAGQLATSRTEPGPHEVWCTPLPLHHVGATVCVTLPAMSVGGAFAFLDEWSVAGSLRMLEETQATFFGGVPTMMLDLMADPRLAATDLSHLRVVQMGGTTIAPSLVRRIEETFAARVVVAYGQSEAPVTIMAALDDSDVVKAETLGRPLPHREVRIARPNGSTAALDEHGELCLRSPLSMAGYWQQPELTAQTIDADGWLHSGDICSMGADGVIRFQGRLREVVIRGGENIYPAEVEDVLLRHPAVGDVAVVGRPSARWGEEVAAFVRLAPGCAADAEALEAFAREHLARFKVPRHWRFVDAFPLTASGKVRKFALVEQLTERT